MFIQIHSLRSFPPHIPNRGADGLAKRAVFGGVERQRISYQCHQYALTNSESIEVLNEQMGDTLRSTLIGPRVIQPTLEAGGMDADAALEWTRAVMGLWGKSTAETEEDGSTKQPLVVGRIEAEALATMAAALQAAGKGPGDLRKLIETRSLKKEPQEVQDAIAACRSILGQAGVSGAMFGRFATGVALSNVRRAVRLSDWLTVHAITPVADFFSTTDNLKDVEGEESGAGHISTRELGAGTFYQHVVVDTRQLQDNLGVDDIQPVIDWLVQALAQIDPLDGRANSRIVEMGVQVGTEQPRSLVDAFTDPMMPAVAPERLRSFAAKQADMDGLGQPHAWLSDSSLAAFLKEVKGKLAEAA